MTFSINETKEIILRKVSYTEHIESISITETHFKTEVFLKMKGEKYALPDFRTPEAAYLFVLATSKRTTVNIDLYSAPKSSAFAPRHNGSRFRNPVDMYIAALDTEIKTNGLEFMDKTVQSILYTEEIHYAQYFDISEVNLRNHYTPAHFSVLLTSNLDIRSTLPAGFKHMSDDYVIQNLFANTNFKI